MPTKTIEQVQLADTITGDDKLLVVKTDCNNKTRSVTVENFIHDNSINTGEINNCAIIEPKIADGAIVNRHICANTIDGNIVTAGTLDANKICSNSITSDRICTDGITADCITGGTIDASQVTVCNINASNITSGTLDAARIGSIDISTCNLNANNITTGTLDADRISANSIDACKLCACSITADQIQACAITSEKIASCAIASSTQIVEGVLLACHINSNSVITNTIQSCNFDGTLVDGEYTVGTQGFSMNASTGTLVLNSLVARNNIIAGNYICYNEEGGFAVDSCGNFKVAVDNDTLTVGAEGLTIKTIPETAVVVAASDINYTGSHNVIDMGRYDANESGYIRVGPEYSNSFDDAVPFLVVPLVESDGGPLNAGVSQIEDIDLYNITFIIDWSNVGNLASATALYFSLRLRYSDISTGFQNTPTGSTRFFTAVTNPVLPLGEVEYTIPTFTPSLNFNDTNKYIIVYPEMSMGVTSPGFTGYITMSAKASLDSRLIMQATGEYNNANRNFSDIIVGAQ